MPLPDFKSSEPFTLGIELELQVVNPPGYDLSQDSSALIAAVKGDIKGGEVKHDINNTLAVVMALSELAQRNPARAAVHVHASSRTRGRSRLSPRPPHRQLPAPLFPLQPAGDRPPVPVKDAP